jgi:hypothetical protein
MYLLFCKNRSNSISGGKKECEHKYLPWCFSVLFKESKIMICPKMVNIANEMKLVLTQISNNKNTK